MNEYGYTYEWPTADEGEAEAVERVNRNVALSQTYDAWRSEHALSATLIAARARSARSGRNGS